MKKPRFGGAFSWCAGHPSVGELQAGEIGIQAFLAQQFRVGTAGDDAALVEHNDTVGALHGSEPMRDHQGGAALHQPLQRLLHVALGLRIE